MCDRLAMRTHLIAAAIACSFVASAYSGAALANPAEYTLYSFSALGTSDTNADGARPLGDIVLGPDGSYYGVTLRGGSSGVGTVFRLNNGTYSVLHTFAGADGDQPTGSLMMASDGNLYGTTQAGGANGTGVIFKVTPGGTFTTLHSFGELTGNSVNSDGDLVFGPLVQGSDGNLYGAAEFGGANGLGTIFRISTAGSYNVLYTFTGVADGGLPFAGLTAGSDGNFYGTTHSTFYCIAPGGTLSTLYSFDTASIGTPYGGVVLGNDGNFYGLTDGVPGKPGTSGTFYSLTPTGAFTAISTLDAPTYAIFNDLTQKVGANVDGLAADSPLVKGADGNFYGLASGGGAAAGGVLFQVTPQGVFSNLHSFDDKADSSGKAHAADPDTSLVFDANGNLIGAGQAGGANGSGAIFTLATNSQLTTNLSFTPSNLAKGQLATVNYSATFSSADCVFVGGDSHRSASGDADYSSGEFKQGAPLFNSKLVTALQCIDNSGGISNATASLSKQ